MYAVIRHGGKQHKVCQGEMLVVDRIDAEEGDKVVFDDVLLVRDDKISTGADVAKAVVNATVLEQFKGDKVLVFKYKPKKNYHRTYGHRQYLTRVKIDEISFGKTTRKKTAKAEGPIETPVEEAPVVVVEEAAE